MDNLAGSYGKNETEVIIMEVAHNLGHLQVEFCTTCVTEVKGSSLIDHLINVRLDVLRRVDRLMHHSKAMQIS